MSEPTDRWSLRLGQARLQISETADGQYKFTHRVTGNRCPRTASSIRTRSLVRRSPPHRSVRGQRCGRLGRDAAGGHYKHDTRGPACSNPPRTRSGSISCPMQTAWLRRDNRGDFLVPSGPMDGPYVIHVDVTIHGPTSSRVRRAGARGGVLPARLLGPPVRSSHLGRLVLNTASATASGPSWR